MKNEKVNHTLKDAINLMNKKEYDKAYDILYSLAKKNNSDAQRLIGEMFLGNWGIKIDYKKSLYWLKKSYKLGNSKAAFFLGYLYDPSLELNKLIESNRQKDLNKSLLYYKKAFEGFHKEALNKNAEAMYNLANCYRNGFGTEINRDEDYKWLKASFDNGYIFSANDLFSIHSSPNNKYFNKEKAQYYFNIAQNNNYLCVSSR